MQVIPMPLPVPSCGGGKIPLSDLGIILLCIIYILSFIMGVLTAYTGFMNDKAFPNVGSVIFFTYGLGFWVGTLFAKEL